MEKKEKGITLIALVITIIILIILAGITIAAVIGDNTPENNYEGIPQGSHCFSGCTKVSNYMDIPAYWK